jgi:hypothetical protein
VTHKPPFRIALAAGSALVLVLTPAALGGKPAAGPTRSCTRTAPSVSVENNWAWGATGSWGRPGQQLAYQVRVVNNDVYCSSSSFVVSLTAPNGFAVSMPTSTISLKSTTQGYLWAYVTSPLGASDGDYPLALTARRAGGAASSTTYYKVYSSDSAGPTLYYPNPGNGQALSGSSYNFAVWSNDDHAVKKIELYVDNVLQTTTTCEDISYDCELYYPMSLLGLRGQHTATFEAYDWMGNPSVLTTTFTVG